MKIALALMALLFVAGCGTKDQTVQNPTPPAVHDTTVVHDTLQTHGGGPDSTHVHKHGHK